VPWQEVFTGAEVLTPSQTLFQRDLIADRVEFREDFVPIEDYPFGALAAHGAECFLAVSDTVTGYRVHGQQSGSRYSPPQVRIRQHQAREYLSSALPANGRLVRQCFSHYYLYVDAATEHELGPAWRMLLPLSRAATTYPPIMLSAMWWKAASLPVRESIRRRSAIRSAP
jgi:hypothetical protein